MKEAKYIKNILYKTNYRTSDDKYKDAIIAFTTVRYDDKSREEFVTLNKIEDNICNEVWKETLSKRISNYDDFIQNNNEWKNLGIYKEKIDKVKFYEPETIISKGMLNTIDEIEIFSVGDENDNLSFVILHDSITDPYYITCNSDNIDIILNELVVNYSKLVDKGKISVKTVSGDGLISDIETVDSFDDYDNQEYYWETNQKKKNKTKIFAGILALVGMGACVLFTSSNNKSDGVIVKARVTTKSSNDETSTTKTTFNTTIESSSTIDSKETLQSTEKQIVNIVTTSATDTTKENTSIIDTKRESIVSNSENTRTNDTTKESTVLNSKTTKIMTSNTTGNNYTVTTKPKTTYMNTSKTVNSKDTAISYTTKKTTKSTTKETVTYLTVDPRDTVTAPSNPDEQIFTKDGATTTRKTSTTTNNNSYEDLIVTNEINDDGKELVLKR